MQTDADVFIRWVNEGGLIANLIGGLVVVLVLAVAMRLLRFAVKSL